MTEISKEGKEILKKWQEKGVVFKSNAFNCHFPKKGEVCDFPGVVEFYFIPEQPLPENFTPEDVDRFVADGFKIRIQTTSRRSVIEFIPDQPIPERLLVKVDKQAPHPKESDPNGLSQHEAGAKLDAGKNRLGLVLGGFARALEEVGKVGTYGAQRYSPDGWKHVKDGVARYDNAMLRHWFSRRTEGKIDPTTGLMHQAHAAWNALAVLELMLTKGAKNDQTN